jgi:homoserine kinase
MNDYRQLAIAMADKLHQPYRLTLIPGADRAYSAAYDAGAMGVALSGAGPSLIAFATMNPEPIAEAMMVAFGSAGLGCRHWILQPAEVGAICTTSPGNSVQSLIT